MPLHLGLRGGPAGSGNARRAQLEQPAQQLAPERIPHRGVADPVLEVRLNDPGNVSGRNLRLGGADEVRLGNLRLGQQRRYFVDRLVALGQGLLHRLSPASEQQLVEGVILTLVEPVEGAVERIGASLDALVGKPCSQRLLVTGKLRVESSAAQVEKPGFGGLIAQLDRLAQQVADSSGLIAAHGGNVLLRLVIDRLEGLLLRTQGLRCRERRNVENLIGRGVVERKAARLIERQRAVRCHLVDIAEERIGHGGGNIGAGLRRCSFLRIRSLRSFLSDSITSPLASDQRDLVD